MACVALFWIPVAVVIVTIVACVLFAAWLTRNWHWG